MRIVRADGSRRTSHSFAVRQPASLWHGLLTGPPDRPKVSVLVAMIPAPLISRELRLELTPRHAGHSNDRLERSDAKFLVIWDGNGHGSPGHILLHYDVASAPSNFHEAMPSQNRTSLLARDDAQLTQWQPPLE